MPTLTCPRCQSRLTVNESAPPILSCPICLARIDNAKPPLPRAVPPPLPAQPRWVIPIEHQVHTDSRNAGYLLFALATVLAAGAWLSLMLPSTRMIGIALAAACVFVLVTGILQIRHPESEAVQNTSAAIGVFASGCFKVFLIVLGVLLLLLGACFALVAGSSFR